MLLLALVPCFLAHADPVPVRYVQGAVHGFVEMRDEAGHIVAYGDLTRTVHGASITSHLTFHFKDGSLDDETTVFTQRHSFQLISDHHIQKGPAFPHPIDMTIDVHSGRVTVRTTNKDGKEEAKTDHLDLKPDLANGIIPILVENMRPDIPGATVSMVVATPKPRLVKLAIFRNAAEDAYTLGGVERKAIHYTIKIDLGGVAAVVALLVGKAPPDIQIWTIAGETATFAREIGPIYAEGPMMTIQLASPAWPESSSH
ncbi:MAG TPA: hypothetical protein VL346_01170 [Acidobacteriaceae bacterium]|nr:hypothetical protein [Acidobacteriaceae bacterium]